MINVRNHGALGDGVNDDASAIQSAVDLVRAQDGGIVYLPAGVYLIGQANRVTPTIQLGSRVTFCGDGMGTVLRRAPGGYAAPMLHCSDAEGLVLCGFALDGAKADDTSFVNHTNQQGIWLNRARDSVISRVWSYGQRTNGIALEYCDGVTLGQCVARDNLKNGFYVSGCDHVSLVGCLGHGNGSIGTTVGSSYSFGCSWHCTLSGCLGWGDVAASLLSGRDTQRLSVAGGSYEGVDVTTEPVGASPPGLDRTGQAGPYDGVTKHGTSHSSFTGLVVRSKYHGIRFVAGSGNLIANNIVRDCALTGIMLYGSHNNVVRGNMITNVGTGGNKNYQAGIVVVADQLWSDASGNVIESNELPGVGQPVHVYALPGGSTEGTRQG